ncbi:MAG TPA: amidohydrolase family protein [Mycobacteriales bacterium]|nr:amidohydrolase family protein [Mycobacteriales bacterium]
MTTLRLAATVLPDGAEAELWTAGGRFAAAPVAGAEDVPGRYVLPGLVDAHAHLTIDMSGTGLPAGSDELVAANLRAQRDAGVLLLRDIGRVRDEPLRTEPDGPEVRQAGRFLGPVDGWVPGLHRPTPPERLLGTVAAQLASGVEWVKVVGDWKHGGELRLNYEPALLHEVAAAVHAAGARLAVHALVGDACRAAVECGADSVEHGCLLDDGLLASMATRGAAWTPTLSAVSTPAPPDHPERERSERRRHDWLDTMRANLPRALALGVPVLAGTDTGPHGSIAGEVALLHEFGLEPVDAIRAATTAARAFLGAPGIEAGAPADFVTFDADPRDDLGVLRTPAAVVRNGVRVR